MGCDGVGKRKYIRIKYKGRIVMQDLCKKEVYEKKIKRVIITQEEIAAAMEDRFCL